MSPFRTKYWINVAEATIYIIWVAQMNVGWYFRDQTECFNWRCLKHRSMLSLILEKKKKFRWRQMIRHLSDKASCGPRPHAFFFLLNVFFQRHRLHSSSTVAPPAFTTQLHKSRHILISIQFPGFSVCSAFANGELLNQMKCLHARFL